MKTKKIEKKLTEMDDKLDFLIKELNLENKFIMHSIIKDIAYSCDLKLSELVLSENEF